MKAEKPALWRRALSWIWPQTLLLDSPLSGTLELNLINGRLRLDSRDANYSYGSLQKVLEAGLKSIWNSSWTDVLVLGLGGGCVVESLREKFGFMGPIEAVEADPVCVQLSEEIFHLPIKYQPLYVYLNYAEKFVKKCSNTYDCIIVDVFVNNNVPPGCLETEFLLGLGRCLRPSGQTLFNVILPEERRLLEKRLREAGMAYRTLVLEHNMLFFILPPGR